MRNQEVSHWALCGSGGSVWDCGGWRARAVRINLQATRPWRARVICRGSYPPLADGLRSRASREPRFSGHRRHGWTKDHGNNLALVHCPPQGERPNSKCNGALLSYAK